MTEEDISNGTEAKIVKSEEQKRKEHNERIIRTGIASIMGIIAGALSFLLVHNETQGVIGFLLLLGAMVFQKHIFMLIKLDISGLGGKDWFYQSFMAFSFWFISWTILLTIQ
ncbi:hypothetical protein L1S32_03395 [Methanogenium sp. S4BF]|uniref:EMC6-like membrane protein n=1 Tax=Methanogenium sp. S4BF TaxID=1789226 RepID=UPI0024175663|nr:hypothetical protein [Methanogenium sp. S4BF]WFN35175.1 hypothetical protein L1S32_03395 [Methanogenium sp. S4BF]